MSLLSIVIQMIMYLCTVCLTFSLSSPPGHFHPITGSEIPSTTMLFRAPASEADLESVWEIVVRSYCWVTLTDDLPGEPVQM